MAVACGDNREGQCDLPFLDAGLTYAQLGAGYGFTVLLRSNGTAVACGNNDVGQCSFPALPAGLTYVQVIVGHVHTILIRSDGESVACGKNDVGQCDLPALDVGLVYGLPTLVLEASASSDGGSIIFNTFGGEEVARIEAAPIDRSVTNLIGLPLALVLGVKFARADIVLPGGELLSNISKQETVASAFGLAPDGRALEGGETCAI